MAFLAALVSGVIAGALALPLLFRSLPHDLADHGRILRAARSARPRVVVFGDSLGEAGIDLRELPVLNLSARGESLESSLLLQQELAGSVTTIVQLVSWEQLDAAEAPSVHALWVYGCRPEASWRVRLRQRLAARWVVLNLPDRLALTLAHGPGQQNDFATRIAPARFAAALAMLQRNAPLPVEAANVRRLDEMARLSAARHRRLILVAPPLHPALRRDDDVRRLLAILRGIRGAEVLDATRLLEEREFSDPLHASAAGARTFSRFLRQAVERER